MTARAANPGILPRSAARSPLHGDNQVWDHDELRLVVDFENIGATEPEYELRAFPGPEWVRPEAATALIRHYQQSPGGSCRPTG